MTTEFTPFMSFIGGSLIGISAILLMFTLGRIMGATGILAGFIVPDDRDDFTWRAVLIAGMITGPLVYLLFAGELPKVQVPVSTTMMIVGGLIVGLGVTFGGGCTSGHGVCGNARLSIRSLVATITFMIATVITVYVVRHIMGA